MLEGGKLFVDGINFCFDCRLNFFFGLTFKFIVIGIYESGDDNFAGLFAFSADNDNFIDQLGYTEVL